MSDRDDFLAWVHGELHDAEFALPPRATTFVIMTGTLGGRARMALKANERTARTST